MTNKAKGQLGIRAMIKRDCKETRRLDWDQHETRPAPGGERLEVRDRGFFGEFGEGAPQGLESCRTVESAKGSL